MSRLVSIGFTTLVLGVLAALSGCGSDNPETVQAPPTKVTLSPSEVSLEIGATQGFTASALDSRGTALFPSPPITFVSSNTAVVTVAANGLACAGTWDSLSNPTFCNPGPVGTAQITSTSRGISSPPTTVHVHQHIDRVTVSPVTTPGGACVKKDDTFVYEARAFSQGLDITSAVGPINWLSLNTNVAGLSTSAAGLRSTQVEATARIPGITSIFATVGSAASAPMQFTTCLVKSIALEVTATGDSSLIASSTAQTLTATVTDTAGNEITGVPLTWCSSTPASIAVSPDCSNSSTAGSTALASVTSTKAGGATILASCIPPRCNSGIQPSRAIYPQGVITATSAGSGTPVNTIVFVASTACDGPSSINDDGCVTRLLQIETASNVVTSTLDLPARPNSLIFNAQGTKAFLGTDKSLLGTKGLMIVTPGTGVTHAISASGKVLAVSPNGNLVILSNTSDSPNQVFVVDTTGTAASTPLSISGATAAAFSPDGLKAFILAGSSLYVYSTVDALRKIDLAPADKVSFLSNGAFAFLANGSTVSVRKTCDNDVATDASGTEQSISLTGAPPFLASLPDATKVLAVNSPGIDFINVNSTPVDCVPRPGPGSPGAPALTIGPVTSFNLGQGSFNATQLLLSSDGTRAYVIASNLASIAVFNAVAKTSSAIALANNATPLRASITTEGDRLYVIGSDDKIHVIDTLAGADTQQVTLPAFPDGLCKPVSSSNSTTFTCRPDLIAVRP